MHILKSLDKLSEVGSHQLGVFTEICVLDNGVEVSMTSVFVDHIGREELLALLKGLFDVIFLDESNDIGVMQGSTSNLIEIRSRLSAVNVGEDLHYTECLLFILFPYKDDIVRGTLEKLDNFEIGLLFNVLLGLG